MKILISDFDGTFLSKNFDENIKFVQDFVREGNIFIIATGRNITSLKKVISTYDIPISYIIYNDGGIILDSNNREIYRYDLDKSFCKKIFNELEKSNIFENVFYDNGYTYQTKITKYNNRIIGKIKNRCEAKDFLDNLQKKYHDNIYAYLSNNWINITSGNNNKAKAIEFLVRINGWLKEEIYTVGNDINDLSMLMAYQGFLVGNNLDNCSVCSIVTFLELKKVL